MIEQEVPRMLLVSGGRGKVAQAITERLNEQGHRLRIVSREPQQVRAPTGCEVIAAATTVPGWETILGDVDRAFVYADPNGLETFLTAASHGRLDRVVMLSAMGIDDAPADTASPIVTLHRTAEQTLRATPLPWTIVRAAGFATNALQWAPGIREHRRVEAAFPDAHANPIHERDIAEVVVRALTAPAGEMTGQTVEITGPESLTQREQVAIIADAANVQAEFCEVSEAEYRSVLAQWGDEALVDALIDGLREASGHQARITNVVQDLTGHPARSFRQWATDHASDFREA